MFPPVREILVADTAVNAALAGRVYAHGFAPQGVTVPYATYDTPGGGPENVLDGLPPIDAYLTRVRVWSAPESGRQVFDIAEDVRNAIEPTAYMEGAPFSGKDPESGRWFVAMQFRFWVDRPAIAASSSGSGSASSSSASSSSSSA